MALLERFGSGMGTTIGVQMRAIAGIAAMSLTGVMVTASEAQPERHAIVTFVVDGDDFELALSFADETFFDQLITGGIKTKAR